MKKTITFIFALVLVISYLKAQDTIVSWTFPDNSPDSAADAGIAANLDKYIMTAGGASAIEYKNGATTKAAQASGWDNGAGIKSWVVFFTTVGYENIKLSSKQTSGGADQGPRNFKVQYSADNMLTWTDVPNTDLITANDWTTGVLTDIALPFECDNQNLIHLRWIMISDTASDGSLLISSGKSKIDDIHLTGSAINNGINVQNNEWTFKIYPNPTSDYLCVENVKGDYSISLINSSGKIVREISQSGGKTVLSLSGLDTGIYMLRIQEKERQKNLMNKVLVR